MILTTLLAALVADPSSRPRARANELKGRLGLQPPGDTEPPGVRKRLLWAMKTFPAAGPMLTFLFAGNLAIRSNNFRLVYSFDNKGTRGPMSAYRGRLPSDAGRYPARGEPGSPSVVQDLWPRPGFRDQAIERLMPWLAKTLSTRTVSEVYAELQSACYDRAMLMEYVDYIVQHDDDYDEDEGWMESPWEKAASYQEMNDKVLEEHMRRYSGPQHAMDPYLLGIIDDLEWGQISRWNSADADDIPIAPIELKFVEDKHESLDYHDRIYEVREIVRSRFRVSDPDDPTAWLELDQDTKAAAGLHSMLRETSFRIVDFGTFERWDGPAEGDEDDDLDEDDEPPKQMLETVASLIGHPDWRAMLRQRIARDGGVRLDEIDVDPSSRRRFLPELEALYPEPVYDEEDLEGESAKSSVQGLSQAPYTPRELLALWQLRWLVYSAECWIKRLQQMRDHLWPKFFSFVIDEIGVTGQAPLVEDRAYVGQMGLEDALNWAFTNHNTRAIDNWHAEHEAERTGKGQVLEPHPDDITLIEWDDDHRLVELSTAAAAAREGQATGHCVASHGHHITNKTRRIFSYRDEDNKPLATIEVYNDDGFTGSDLQGPGNRPISRDEELAMVRPRVAAFLRLLRGEHKLGRQESDRLEDQGDLSAADLDLALEDAEVSPLLGGPGNQLTIIDLLEKP